MKSGTNAAGLQFRSLGDGNSQDAQYWNENNNQKAREKQAQDNILHQREQAEKKRKAGIINKFKGLDNAGDTGNKSLTETFGKYVQKLRTEEYPKHLQTLLTAEEGSDEYLQATMALNNLEKVPERLNQVASQVKADIENHQKLVESGEAWEEPDTLKKFHNYYSRLELDTDDSGNFNVVFIDKNNDGINDNDEVIGFNEYKNGYTHFKNVPKFDLNKIAVGAVSEIGKSDTTTFNGNYSSTQIKQLKEDALDNKVNEILGYSGEGQGDGSAVYRSLLREYQIEDNPVNRTKARDIMKQKIKDSSDYFKKEDRDNSGRASNINAQTNRIKAQNKGKENTPKKLGVSDVSEQTYDVTANNIDKDKAQNVNITPVKLDLVKGTDGESYSNVKVQGFTYNKDGKMVVDATSLKTKSISKKEIEERESKGESLKDRLISGSNGEQRIVLPSQNKRGNFIASSEDEARILDEAGLTKEEAIKMASKEEETKPKKPTNSESVSNGRFSKYNKPK